MTFFYLCVVGWSLLQSTSRKCENIPNDVDNTFKSANPSVQGRQILLDVVVALYTRCGNDLQNIVPLTIHNDSNVAPTM